MIRLIFFVLITLAFVSCDARDKEKKRGKEKNTPGLFLGAKSDISSDDEDRASKAIKKWSSSEGKQDGKRLSKKPYYWDHTRVGRHVFIRVIKNDNRKGLLEVFLKDPATGDFEKFKGYRIKFFSGDPGPKMEQGDGQAPEGFYFISPGRMNPKSDFHLSMDLGYPNAFDRAHQRTGDFLMIHGSYLSVGCFAMTDCSIEQIYTLVHKAFENGQKYVRVHSFPFPMTEENLEAEEENEHYEFWKNLKEGWDLFEKNRRPPNVEVEGKAYVFKEP